MRKRKLGEKGAHSKRFNLAKGIKCTAVSFQTYHVLIIFKIQY